MRFKISTSGRFYSKKAAKKLRAIGFEFKPARSTIFPPPFEMTGGEVFREFETLEELMSFVAEWGGEVVIRDGEIEIYDDYRE
jgi:hypothetical protein